MWYARMTVAPSAASTVSVTISNIVMRLLRLYDVCACVISNDASRTPSCKQCGCGRACIVQFRFYLWTSAGVSVQRCLCFRWFCIYLRSQAEGAGMTAEKRLIHQQLAASGLLRVAEVQTATANKRCALNEQQQIKQQQQHQHKHTATATLLVA